MRVCGIRGAVESSGNTREDIHKATRSLLQEMLERNAVAHEDIASVFLTATPDLNADFPAYAARAMGLTTVPLLCAQEMNVPGAMKSVIRALMHVNTEKAQRDIVHCYLGETSKLRPDAGAHTP